MNVGVTGLPGVEQSNSSQQSTIEVSDYRVIASPQQHPPNDDDQTMICDTNVTNPTDSPMRFELQPTSERAAIENDPATQDTLSQIEELVEDETLATEIKEIYQEETIDIRQFFNTKETQQPTDDDDEVQVVSPAQVSINRTNRNDPPPGRIGVCVDVAIQTGVYSTRLIDMVDYKLCYPRLTCVQCEQFNYNRIITVAEDSYYELMKHSQKWFFPDTITTFGLLCAHTAHRDDTIYVDAMLPDVKPDPKKTKVEVLLPTVKTIVSVVFKDRHFAVMRLCLDNRKAYFYDGLAWSVRNWSSHMNYILNLYGISSKNWKSTLATGHDSMDGIMIKQDDHNNCGPIACMVLWKLFRPSSVDLAQLQPNDYRAIVIDELRRMLKESYNLCIVYKKERKQSRITNSMLQPDTKTAGEKVPLPPRKTKIPRVAQRETPESSPEPVKTEHPILDSTPSPTLEIYTDPSITSSRKPTGVEENAKNVEQPSKHATPITAYFEKKAVKNDVEKDTDVVNKRTIPQIEQRTESTNSSETKMKTSKKRKTIVESEDETEWDDIVEGSPRQKARTEGKNTVTARISTNENPESDPVTQQADCLPIPKDGKGIVTEDPKKAVRPDEKPKMIFDGLDSDDEDIPVSLPYSPLGLYEESPETAKSEKKKGESQITPPSKKPRIKIPNPKGILGKLTNKLRGKCNCKKECNKKCGCWRKGQNCTIACACKGGCKNNPKS